MPSCWFSSHYFRWAVNGLKNDGNYKWVGWTKHTPKAVNGLKNDGNYKTYYRERLYEAL